MDDGSTDSASKQRRTPKYSFRPQNRKTKYYKRTSLKSERVVVVKPGRSREPMMRGIGNEDAGSTISRKDFVASI